jgi:hypothetical protein
VSCAILSGPASLIGPSYKPAVGDDRCDTLIAAVYAVIRRAIPVVIAGPPES